MAKPIINFNAVKYTIGTTTGYRPQLVTATKFYDLQVAEEIVLAKRMSMSPEELLHCIQTVITTVPELVASDGIVREFKSMLCWNRTATGRLDGVGGAWNDTCRARVNLQQLKDCKFDIDATFVNEITSPRPKVDNVSYPGTTVTNVIKQGKQIILYGRNLFVLPDGEDKVWLVPPGGQTQYQLTCVESDVAHAVFSWPTAAPTFEAGTAAEIVSALRGGVAEGGFYTNRKSVVILEADPPPPAAVRITSLVDQDHIGSSTDYIDRNSRYCHIDGVNIGCEVSTSSEQLIAEQKDADGNWNPYWDIEVTESSETSVDFNLPQPPQMSGARAVRVKVSNGHGTSDWRTVEIQGW